MNTTRRLRTTVVAAILLAAPLLSSCGVNFDAQTDQDYMPGLGVNDRSGTVDVLHALVVSGSAGSGTVVAALVNNNQETPDRLVEVTGAADQGTQVTLSGGPLDIPADGALQLANEGDVTVTGDRVAAGKFVTLSFAFENSETITVEAPVYANTDDFADVPVPSGTN